MEIQLYMLSFTDKTETVLVPKVEFKSGKRIKINVENEGLVKYYKISKYVVSSIKDNLHTYVITPQTLYYSSEMMKGMLNAKKFYTTQEQGLIALDKINFVYNEIDEHDKRNNKKVPLDKLDCVFKTNANVSFNMQIKRNYLDEENQEDFETTNKEQIDESMEHTIDVFNNFVEKEQK